MNWDSQKKVWIGSLLAGSAAIVLFLVIFFALGPLVFGEPIAPVNTNAQDHLLAQKFEEILNFVGKNYVDPVDRQKLFDGAMRGLFASLGDPYSLYLTESEMMSLNDTTTGEFGGVGLYINKQDPSQSDATHDANQKYVEVVAPIEDTPAWKAGLLAGDYITKIEGQDVGPMTMDDVLKKLRGKPGTDVKITVLRGSATTMEFSLKRQIIEVPSVKSTWIGDDIAYLRIIQFTAHTPADFDAAIAEFSKKGFSRLVIDLRNNPGGLLEAVAKIGGRFFKDGVIVSTRSRVPGESAIYNAEGGQTIPDSVRIVVLVNKGSASAAEILSGALKDRKRAFLLGETTYGKGSVQQVIPFDKTGFKLTMARYYTPSGVNIDKVGIKPDETLKVPPLTDAQLADYKKLADTETFDKFAQGHKLADSKDISTFVGGLQTNGSDLSARLLSRLTRLALDKANSRAEPIVDLDFDVVLDEALKLLRASTFSIP